MEKVEGAAAGLYVAALFESARPGHRGLNAARLAADARRAVSRRALGRLHLACRTVRAAPLIRCARRESSYRRSYRPPRPRGAGRVKLKPRPAEAA